MKKLPVLISFLFSTLFLWSANPVPYSGKVAINGVNYFGEAQFSFPCTMERVRLIGEMVNRQAIPSKFRCLMDAIMFYWVGRG